MKTTARILLCCMLVLICAPLAQAGAAPQVAAGEIDFAAVDRYVSAQMRKHGLPGVSLAVTRGEEVLYLQGYGTAGQGRPMTPDTPMYLGSQSKSITGLALAQLAAQGKVDINQPVQAYIPEFKVADPVASAKITVSHLLHHTSGLSEAGYTAVLPEDAPRMESVRALAGAELTAPVGTQFQYFNTGFDVLAVIIERISGQTYEDYVQAHIFDPLGMTRTYTDPELARQNGLAQGYSRFFGFAVPRRQPHRIYDLSAGYIMSTAENMAHFAIAMNNGGAYQGRQVLDATFMPRLFVPVQGYGWGWFIGNNQISHGGANETFATYVNLYPSQDIGIVLLINQGYMIDHFVSTGQVFAGVEAIVLGRTPPPVEQGWSPRVIGWILLAVVAGVTFIEVRGFLSLRGWRERAKNWPARRRAWDVAVSFIIPTAILIVVFWQVSQFFGTRWNFTYQLQHFFIDMTDIAVLCVIGTFGDYIQGLIKLYWSLTGARGRSPAGSTAASPSLPG